MQNKLQSLIFICCALASLLHAKTLTIQELDETYQVGIHHFLTALNGRDIDKTSDFFNLEKTLERAFRGLEISEKYKAGFSSGVLNNKRNIGVQLIEQMSKTGYAHLTQLQKEPIGYSALIRIDYGEQGWNFTRFYFQKETADTVKIVDLYAYTAGQLTSETFRKLIVLTSPEKGNISRLLPFIEKMEAKKKEPLYQFFQYLGEGKNVEAIQQYRTLEPEFKKEKSIIIAAIQTASQTGDETLYREMLGQLHQYHGDDPSLTFMLIDYHFYQEDYEEVIKSIRALNEEIGVEDPALLSMLSNALNMNGQAKEAVKVAKKAQRLEPSLEAPLWSLVSAYTNTKQYYAMVSCFKRLNEHFGYHFEKSDFENDPAYVEFANSKAMEEWITEEP